MTVAELKDLLNEGEDVRPKYLFRAVERNTGLRDYRYVFWLDLMGTRNLMKISESKAARSVMKIPRGCSLSEEQYKEVEINPVMDGVYGFVASREVIEAFLRHMLTSLAAVFVHERVTSSRFMVRAGLSFGPIVPGVTLAKGAAILQKNLRYLRGTAIGMAISHAYEAESAFPPFGVYIHESARAFAPRDGSSEPYRSNLWRWFGEDEPLSWAIRRTLVDYFDWASRNPVASKYESTVLAKHRALADEYFRLYQLTEQQAE